jgi:hypothetical protein
MNRSGQQYPGEIAAGGPEAPEGLPGADTRVRFLRESSPAHARGTARCRYASTVFTRVITRTTRDWCTKVLLR